MSIIKNKSELANSKLRADALDILEAGLEVIQTKKILREKIRIENDNLIIQNGNKTESTVVPLSYSGRGVRGEGDGKVIFIGIGKCALDGAKVMEEILGEHLTTGAVIDVRDESEAADLKKCRYFQGTHPLPSEQNVQATKEILNMTGDLTEEDLVICLISGGGSSLFDVPNEAGTAKLGLPRETPLQTIIRVTKELTSQGADIYELNEERKKMSLVKGGKFAKICKPARMVSLIFSDVPGDDISVIASGPTFTEGVENILICSNKDALNAMRVKAQELGFEAKIETDRFSKNAAEFGKELAQKEINPKTCLLFGGESTVIVPNPPTGGHGLGGRNQELALSALLYIREDELLLASASDGWDNTDHCGAMVDTELMQKAKTLGIAPENFLLRGDSYNFFKQIGDGAISTGRLGSNVSDLVIILSK